jgi:SAM-dependent methyltransferase
MVYTARPGNAAGSLALLQLGGVARMKSIDFGRAADDYARHRVGYPSELFDRLQKHEIGVHQQRVLDLGTGTGTLGRGFARRGCEVTGLEIAPELLEQSKRLDLEAKVSMRYLLAEAEHTGVPSGAFDVVCAGQSWHWFKRQKAARESRRVLVPGGTLVLAHFDWLPLPDTVVEATEELILHYNRRWELAGSAGVYPEWLTDVRVAGFVGVESFSFDVDVPFTHEGWRGAVRASSGVGASMSRGNVVRFDEKLRSLLVERFTDEPLHVPYRLWVVTCRSPRG